MNYKELTKFLTEKINKNINWNEIINKFITSLDSVESYLNGSSDEKDKKNIEKFIKRVKLLGWIDKSDPIESTTRDYYNEYYTKLIMQTNYKNKHIGILYKETDNINSFVFNYSERVDVLDNLLTFKGISHTITNEVAEVNKTDIIIILTQFEYDNEELKRIDKNKLITPTDEYYNIIHTKENKDDNETDETIKTTYDFIHLLETYMKTEQIIIKKYPYIYI